MNLSLVGVAGAGLAREEVHLHLAEMPLYSPVFYICDQVFTLALLLHDADYYHQVHLHTIYYILSTPI